jgi:hypothetical protein
VSGLQRGDGLLPGHGRKRVQKLVEAVVPLEIIDEVPERNPRPDEYRRTTEDVRIAVHDPEVAGMFVPHRRFYRDAHVEA